MSNIISDISIFQNWVKNYDINCIHKYLNINNNKLKLDEINAILSYDKQIIYDLINNKTYIPDYYLIQSFSNEELTLSDLILFINNGLIICDKIINHIIINNNVECYEYLIINHKTKLKLDNKLISNIFIWGFQNIINLSLTHLNLLIDNLYPIIPFLIKKGQINSLKQINIHFYTNEDNNYGIYSTDDIELAIENGNLELFKYIYENTDFFMEDINKVKRNLLELSIKYGKFNIFEWLFINNIYTDYNDNQNQEFLNTIINISIKYNRDNFINYLIDKYVLKYNIYPNLQISTILGNNNVQLLNNYLDKSNKPILLSTKFYITTWVENNQYSFDITENIYQIIIKNINISQLEFPFIFNRIQNYINNSKNISKLLVNNTILSHDIINSLILKYLWNI